MPKNATPVIPATPASKPAAGTPTLPIMLRLARGRDDGGQTANFRVYEGGGVITATNGRGESVTKNTVMGGNGSVYLANAVAAGVDDIVILSRAQYEQLLANQAKAKR